MINIFFYYHHHHHHLYIKNKTLNIKVIFKKIWGCPTSFLLWNIKEQFLKIIFKNYFLKLYFKTLIKRSLCLFGKDENGTSFFCTIHPISSLMKWVWNLNKLVWDNFRIFFKTQDGFRTCLGIALSHPILIIYKINFKN